MLTLPILYQDRSLIAVNKPADLLSVPGRGADKQDSVSLRLSEHFPNTRVVHRLDMATSGIMLFPQSHECLSKLGKLFQDRQVEKRYVAVVNGQLANDQGEVELPLICDWPNRPRQKVCHETGKPSLTRYQLIHYDAETNTSRVALFPVTGRSHQLRVHMQAIGHPIIGDNLYGCEESQKKSNRLNLHAEFIRFLHPIEGHPVEINCGPNF